ncbi:MAG TPA: EAL domain-containing protein [Arenicellales bacterium]|nr:EAL domain-containing protein [Arenicellales bacterium]
MVQQVDPPRAEDPSILLISDDPAMRREIHEHLHREFRSPVVSSLGNVADLSALPPDQVFSFCIVCDSPGMNSLEVLTRMRDRYLACPVLLMLEPANERLAAEATRRGFTDYIIRTSGYGERLRAKASAIVQSGGEAASVGYRDNFRALEINARQFRDLVENAAEGILIHVDEKPVYVNDTLVSLLGFDHRDQILELDSIYEFVDAWDRERALRLMRRVSAGMETPKPYVFRARRRDGRLLWLENRVNIVQWQGYPAVQSTLVDVSERQRATNALRLAARVASRAGAQASFEDAIRVALRWLGRGLAWELAESWIPGPQGDVLEPGPVWTVDKRRFARFIESSRRKRFAKGESLAGAVWESGNPEWIDNVSDAHRRFRRSILANEVNLKTGCAIPIMADGRIVVVLCFFTSDVRLRSHRLVTALNAGAASLGPVLMQIRAEQARRAGMARLDTLISHNLDGILVLNEQGGIVFGNPAAREMFGTEIEGAPFGIPACREGVADVAIRNVGTGAVRTHEMRVAEIDWDGSPARLVSLRDITERLEAQRALERNEATLRERVKELRCMYAVSGYLARPRMDLSRMLQHVVDAIPDGWARPASTCARVRIDDLEVCSSGFRESRWRLSSDVRIEEEQVGVLEVYCDEDPADDDGGPFLKEEVELLDELARRIGQALSTRRYQQELRASRRRFQDFAEAASDWLWEMDENFNFTYLSDRIRVVMGQPLDHWIGRSRRELAAETDVENDEKWQAHTADMRAHRPFRNFRYEIALPDGDTRHIAISGVPVFDEDGRFTGYRGSGTDETGQVIAENRARESDRRLEGIADRLPGIVYQRLRRPDGRLEYPYLSAGARDLLGVGADEIKADPLVWTDRMHPEDRSRFHVALDQSSRALEPMELRYRVETRTGDTRWVWHRSAPRRLSSGDTVWDCIELDITEQKAAEARVQYLGYHDQLTGLPNRELFVERVAQVLPIAQRNSQPVAVAMLGLNRFKQVNEEFGMPGGDEVLRAAAARFSECLRPGDTVARLGGDRFLFLLPSVGPDPATHKPLERLVEAMERPFAVNQKQILLTFNMGVAIFPDDGDSAEVLIQKADTAQAHFSRTGPGLGYAFYRGRMTQPDDSRLALEKDLRDAIESGDQIEAHFQPIYSASTGRLIAVETLARWQHPERGAVPPVEFIPLAEEAGLINLLGLNILRQACSASASWERAGLERIVVTVNISARQIRDTSLAQSIKRIVHETGAAPHRLTLEVTESSLIADLERGSRLMEELVADGVHFALDDFGVGYSSLSYLARLPVHALKIDRSFIRDLGRDLRGEATIRAIVALARALGLHVVAEGIETRELMEHAKFLGCDTLQGFWLGRPMPAAELESLLRRPETLAAVRDTVGTAPGASDDGNPAGEEY